MKCPYCGNARTRVIDTTRSAAGIRRRRVCRACDQRFSTMERAILTTPVNAGVNAELFDAAGTDLVIVSNYAVGVDNIDVAEAERRGIAVGHTPGAVNTGLVGYRVRRFHNLYRAGIACSASSSQSGVSIFGHHQAAAQPLAQNGVQGSGHGHGRLATADDPNALDGCQIVGLPGDEEFIAPALDVVAHRRASPYSL